MPPLQIGPSFVGEAVGTALTVTAVVYTVAGLQPLPLVLTVNEYVVVVVGVIAGFCAAELDPSDPVHDQAVAPLEFALRCTVPPTQIGPSFVGEAVGTALTVTEVV